MKQHSYHSLLKWTGNTGEDTSNYQSYDRSYVVSIDGKPDLYGSSDPAFNGDPKKYNPEDLLLVSLSACHMLWYLHLCSDHGIVVTDYRDQAQGTMELDKDGSGKFTEVVLHPSVKVMKPENIIIAEQLHGEASKKCFIANSCNFPILHQPEVTSGKPETQA
ncbi:MAG: OsmC family protein [Cyclobacteriaceae bacterium]|nr:OsmC family protein [Cyclobacteriaceae bacterium HetDA_MAG_MS6]